jgi:Cu/Ag efflux protein CusF
MKIRMTLLLAALAAPAPALAQGMSDHGAHGAAPKAAATAALTEGEVRKVDRTARTITLKHGAIPNIGMTPMTMQFRAADPAMLDRVKVGDKVRFTADKVGGDYVVTRIEPAK